MIYVHLYYFNHKTAYDIPISDWSSDVCSSNLPKTGPESVFGASFKGCLYCDGLYFVDLVMALPTLLMSAPAPATVLAQPAISEQPSKASAARILVLMTDSFL